MRFIRDSAEFLPLRLINRRLATSAARETYDCSGGLLAAYRSQEPLRVIELTRRYSAEGAPGNTLNVPCGSTEPMCVDGT